MAILSDLLTGAGNVLDTPGSVVRGLLAGDASSALGGILDPTKRLSGRDLLDKWGLTDENSGLAGDIGGFAAQMATDPLTYFGGTLAAKLLGKTHGLPGVIPRAAGMGIAEDAGAQAAKAAAAPVADIANPATHVPTFYSRTARAAENLPENVKGESLLNLMKKAPEGVSAEELGANKLSELAQPGTRVSREAVENHVAKNQMEVGETWKDSSAKKLTESSPGVHTTQNGKVSVIDDGAKSTGRFKVEADDGRVLGVGNTEENALAVARRREGDEEITAMLENDVIRVVPSGLKRFRLVNNKTGETMDRFHDFNQAAEWANAKAGVTGSVHDRYTTPGGENYKELLLKHNRESGEPFTHQHWPGEKDVIAHARMNDRVGPNGEKILHVEEVQSDLHQAGKKRGYIGEKNAAKDIPPGAKYSVHEEPEGYVVRGPGGEHVGTYMDGHYAREDAHNVFPVEGANEIPFGTSRGTDTKVPNAPFKDTWHELTMKKILRHAAEEGYDAVTWNTGDQIKKIVGGEGSGQREFYDKVLPNFMDKYTKKWGMKTEPISIQGEGLGGLSAGEKKLYLEWEADKGLTPHGVRLTPKALSDILLKGQPLLSAGGAGILGASAANQFGE